MELIFLGTGAGVPAKERNVSSVALQLLAERGTTWLFDCGEATQHQILYTPIKPRRIEKIFITHLHGDHIFGLPGLLGSRSFQSGETDLTVYGPKGLKEYILTSLSLSKTHLKYRLHIHEIEKEGTLFEDEEFKVIVKKLEHGIDSFGYRIVEKDLPGTLLVNELKKLAIPPGPIYQKIKAGEMVTLDDGRVINGNDFIGPSQKGRVITILGDTRYCENSLELALDANILVHEATFCADDETLAYEYYHSTTSQAATIAKRANVKNLILTHISSRYQNEEVKRLEDEAKEIFPPTSLASDLYTCNVGR
ncbi:ribonuclease Z [Bacillus sp. PS06]|uniref:ribonuclease Z n=1 Tax=Bacillus sp. PS06 TaxID=2764176 RepID=UPI00177ABA0B|nr:ribonuclease Z [Bacillus sp. PS06]MBD8070365.1 ribonuclease Z [Bacillus sp. PS06]